MVPLTAQYVLCIGWKKVGESHLFSSSKANFLQDSAFPPKLSISSKILFMHWYIIVLSFISWYE